MPVLNIINTGRKSCIRKFSSKLYNVVDWYTDCDVKNKFICGLFLLFSSENNVARTGRFGDLNNFHKANVTHGSKIRPNIWDRYYFYLN